MTNTLKTLIRRILGCPNPYAGYVEACTLTAAHLAPDTVYVTGRSLRHRYDSFGFQAEVENHRMVR